MAGDTKYTVQIVGDIQRLRRTMREAQRLTDQMEKSQTKSMKARERFTKDYDRDFSKTIKRKEDHFKAELRHFDVMARKTRQEEQKAKRSFRQMQQDFVRSPMGKFFVGREGRFGQGIARGGTALFRGGVGLMGGLAGMLIGASVQGYQRLGQYSQAMGGLSGMGPGRAVRAGMGRRMGASLGFNLVESAQQARLMGRATGTTGPRELQQAMRATGLGAGEAASIFGTMAQGGLGFGGVSGVARGQSRGGREFQRMIAAGMESGLARGRLPEFFQGVTRLMQEQQRVRVGEVGASDYAKTLALWGKTGLAGMQGMRGASILQQINQGIKRPGGGEAGKALMMQAMGFGKPGGNTGFYEAEKMREQGASGQNIMKVMTEVEKQFGTGQEAALTLREVFGVSLEQAEELLKIYDSSASAEEKLAKIDEKMEESKSLEQQSLDYLKSTAAMTRRMAGRFDESISHGAKAAKYIEAVEDWQFKLVNLMFKAVEWLEKLYQEVKIFIDGFLSGKSIEQQRTMREAEKIKAGVWEKTSSKERAQKLMQAAAQYKRAADVGIDIGTGEGIAYIGRGLLGGKTLKQSEVERKMDQEQARKMGITSDAQAQLYQAYLSMGMPDEEAKRRARSGGYAATIAGTKARRSYEKPFRLKAAEKSAERREHWGFETLDELVGKDFLPKGLETKSKAIEERTTQKEVERMISAEREKRVNVTVELKKLNDNSAKLQTGNSNVKANRGSTTSPK